jgi:hypothetical protein
MWTRRSIALASAFLLLGLTIGAAGGWYVASENLGSSWNGALYWRSAAEASLQTRLLTKLRQGESKAAIEVLESLLDANLLMLSGLEGALIPEGKADDVDAALNEVREYRKKHPSQRFSQRSQEAIDRVLSREQ